MGYFKVNPVMLGQEKLRVSTISYFEDFLNGLIIKAINKINAKNRSNSIVLTDDGDLYNIRI